mmetsp:Transcript_76596/g.212787  ORF Transcript_76596/g.212787 Transcript_76596/m.212787 type:complete len:536 (-) Transcript_76596:163-1770(-)
MRWTAGLLGRRGFVVLSVFFSIASASRPEHHDLGFALNDGIHGAAFSVVQVSATAIVAGVPRDPQALLSTVPEAARPTLDKDPVARNVRMANATGWDELWSRAVVSTTLSTTSPMTFGFVVIAVLVFSLLGAYLFAEVASMGDAGMPGRSRTAGMRGSPPRAESFTKPQATNSVAQLPPSSRQTRLLQQGSQDTLGGNTSQTYMNIRRSEGFPNEQAEVTRLAAHSPPGSTRLSVATTRGFNVYDKIVVGNTEMRQIIALDNVSFTLDQPVRQQYPANTDVRRLGPGQVGILERVSLNSGVTPPTSNYQVPHVEHAFAPDTSSVTSNSQRSFQAGPSTPARPPPVCKELVLPHCDAMFAVSFDMLEEASGSFELYGLSGKPLLRADVQKEPMSGRGMLTISMKPAKSPALCTLINVPSGGRPHIEVKDKNNAPYGEIVCTGPMQFILTHQGREVMQLAFDSQSSQLILTSAFDGSTLACASKCMESDFFQQVEHLEVRVYPGVDAVLALLCIIGVLIFGAHHGRDLPMGSPSRHM